MESDQTTIRRLVAADVPALGSLLAQLRYDVPADELDRRLVQMLASAEHDAFVCDIGGGICGFVHVYGRPAFEKPPAAIVVDVSTRRSGVGRRLMAAAEAWARVQRYASLALHASTDRASAHAFYTALGYHRAATAMMFRRSLLA